MSYVYDLLLNFKEEYYDFYDWNMKDGLTHMRRIPIFKVTTQTIFDFLNYDLTLSDTFLNQIENQSEVFLGRRIKKEKHAFLITDTRKVIAIQIKGKELYISDLLLDEEEEALELVPILPLFELEYEKVRRNQKQKLKTRKQMEFEKYINKEIQNLMKKNNEKKLKYIYYECFDKKEDSKEVIIEEIQNQLENNFSHFSKKLDYLLKMIQGTI